MIRPIADRADGSRLRTAREAAGFATAADFIRRARCNGTLYMLHESGRRRYSRNTARLYAALLNVKPGDLLLEPPTIKKGDPRSFDTPVSRRLKQARLAAGFDTAKDFAAYANVNATTYAHHESGRRLFGTQTAVKYATALRIPARLLLPDIALHAHSRAPIVGRIGAGGIIVRAVEPFRSVAVPYDLGHPTEAYDVPDNTMFPAFMQGDVVLCEPLNQVNFRLSDVDGMQCVVRLAGDKLILAMVHAQPNGLAELEIWSSPRWRDVRVLAASPIELTIHAPLRRRLTGDATPD